MSKAERVHDDWVDAFRYAYQALQPRWGFLFRWGSLWVGAHYSRGHRRWCINLVPFVTLWITLPGGVAP